MRSFFHVKDVLFIFHNNSMNMNDFMALISYECSLMMKFLYNGETHIKTHQNNNKWRVCCSFTIRTRQNVNKIVNNFWTDALFLMRFSTFYYPIFPLSIFSSVVICKYRRTRHKADLLVKVTKSAIFLLFLGLGRTFSRLRAVSGNSFSGT